MCKALAGSGKLPGQSWVSVYNKTSTARLALDLSLTDRWTCHLSEHPRWLLALPRARGRPNESQRPAPVHCLTLALPHPCTAIPVIGILLHPSHADTCRLLPTPTRLVDRPGWCLSCGVSVRGPWSAVAHTGGPGTKAAALSARGELMGAVAVRNHWRASE
eukprot:scaffold3523_cov108-Isochrysis_galbana.AAC.2